MATGACVTASEAGSVAAVRWLSVAVAVSTAGFVLPPRPVDAHLATPALTVSTVSTFGGEEGRTTGTGLEGIYCTGKKGE